LARPVDRALSVVRDDVREPLETLLAVVDTGLTEVNVLLLIVAKFEGEMVPDEGEDVVEGPFRISVVTMNVNEVIGVIDLVVLVSLPSFADCKNDVVMLVETGPRRVVSMIKVNEVTGSMAVEGVETSSSTADIAISMALVLFINVNNWMLHQNS
jgi:hypothetical protein